MKISGYDKLPSIAVPDAAGACVVGWDAIEGRLRRAIARRNARRSVVVVECYPGVDATEVLRQLEARLDPVLALGTEDLLRAPGWIDRLVEPFLGGDDPVFGSLGDLTLEQFFDPALLGEAAGRVGRVEAGVVLIVLFLTILSASLLPARLLDAAWQLRVGGALSNA